MKRKTSFYLVKAHKLGILSTDKVKLGIVGCGSTTRCVYGPFFKYLENGRFVAVSDVEEEQARWAQNMCQAYEIYTE